jgi:hypothetical protein
MVTLSSSGSHKDFADIEEINYDTAATDDGEGNDDDTEETQTVDDVNDADEEHSRKKLKMYDHHEPEYHHPQPHYHEHHPMHHEHEHSKHKTKKKKVYVPVFVADKEKKKSKIFYFCGITFFCLENGFT